LFSAVPRRFGTAHSKALTLHQNCARAGLLLREGLQRENTFGVHERGIKKKSGSKAAALQTDVYLNDILDEDKATVKGIISRLQDVVI
jgi:hypothetical protein